MSQSASIKLGEVNGYSWIRICGRGDVFLAPQLKALVEKILSKSPSPKLVVDMEDCSGMDSTFMGALASFAIKLKKVSDSCFHLCGVAPSNQESLEELGLDTLMEINPENAEWSGDATEIRSDLSCWVPQEDSVPDEDLILDTHKTLGNLNEKNNREFNDIIKSLEK